METKVLDHVPHGDSKQGILESLALIKPLSPILICSCVLLACFIREHHRHNHVPWEACGVHITYVIKLSTAHHQGTHEWHDAKDFHKVLTAVEAGKVVWVFVCNELVLIEVLFRSKVVLQHPQAHEGDPTQYLAFPQEPRFEPFRRTCAGGEET